ncbi:helix-turn-helix domain-containing protein [Rhodococcus sp. BP22]|uniref:helix-turn-helix domain-containing protein n=1 Tax=Rhodococcus sp. BP22 TaxID=2758566 RepID=UPI0016464383|nr:XRE family transcriptional regulator [Rhodococcus sp. BP22]
MDTKTLGGRIKQAREDLNFTQDHLANRAGIDRTALTRIEKGDRKVSAVELVKLADVLATPLAWFVRDPLPMVVSRRSDAGPAHEVTALMDRQLELFAGDVASLLDSGVITAAADRPQWRTPKTHPEAENIARQVRAHLGVGTDPLLGLPGIAERLGLFSCSLGLGEGGADGAMVEVADHVAVAVVDGDTKIGRRRMSLAHELGHWLFGDAFDSGVGDAERMINSFAAHLLAPRAGINRIWREHPGDTVRDKAVRVASTFGMSWSAVIFHLRNLNFIDQDEYRTLEGRNPVNGEFAKLGLTLSTDELRPPSLSPALTAAIMAAYIDRRMTGPRAVELLRDALTEEDLPERREETAEDFASL